MNTLPEPISLLIELYQTEEQVFRKVHRLIDLAEAVIKFHTVVIVSNYMEDNSEISENAKSILYSGLKTPSLGIWALFTRELHIEISEERAFWPDFKNYFHKVLKQATNDIIPFRNLYAHGSTPSDEKCMEDCKKIFPPVEKILNAGFIGRDELLVGDQIDDSQNHSVSIKRVDGRVLNLSPLLIYKEHFFYYNDIRNDKAVSLLNYDASIHERDRELRVMFDQVFPLSSWRKVDSPFHNRIQELTETFKGRSEELNAIQKFVRKNSHGHYFIWGSPGIGKSALVARIVQTLQPNLFKEQMLSFPDSNQEEQKNVIVMEYFIRRSTQFSDQDYYLNTMFKQLETKFQTGIQQGNNPTAKIDKYFERFQAISEKLQKDNKKLIIFIDGLDEANDDLIKILPVENYPNILFLFSSRDVPIIRKLYLQGVSLQSRQEIIIQGLKTDDVRAILYDYVNKYELQSQYVEEIVNRSQGNPLYLRLLCNSLFSGESQLNDIQALPKEIGNFYKSILERFSKSSHGDKIWEFLYFLTVSFDFLHADTISKLLGISRQSTDLIIEETAEVLFENPLTEDYEDWQLFHESLREYIKENYPREVSEMQKRLIDVCRSWEQLCEEDNDRHTIRYVLKYYVQHLVQVIE